MAKYHVTEKWNGKDLMSAVKRFGFDEALAHFVDKWGDNPEEYIADQITKIYLYASVEEAIDHKDFYGGEILVIDDSRIDIFEDWAEGSPVLATSNQIPANCISRI